MKRLPAETYARLYTAKLRELRRDVADHELEAHPNKRETKRTNQDHRHIE